MAVLAAIQRAFADCQILTMPVLTFLFTDIEGSAKLWDAAPDAMKQALARHDVLLRAAIEGHQGRVFKTVGDAFCAVFDSAPQALLASVEAQRALVAQPWSSHCYIRVRMAVHTEDAEARDNDYFGSAPTRVARVLAAGHGGQILLTRATQEACGGTNLHGILLRFLGEFSLRGLAASEQLYQVDAEAIPSKHPALLTASADNNTASIAVLPFANVGRQEEGEYFADGLADELISVLGKIRDMRVASRTSAFGFRGEKIDLAEVARKLNVVNVLEGSVRQASNRLRVAIKLVEVATETVRWSETYDRVLDDVFAIQDEIARSVVEELRRALVSTSGLLDSKRAVSADVALAARGRGVNPQAHMAYLKANAILRSSTKAENLIAARNLFHQALEIEAQCALAWAGLSRANFMLAGIGAIHLVEGVEEARKNAATALALDSRLSEAHYAMGEILFVSDMNLAAAEHSFRTAVELAPGHVFPNLALNKLLLLSGRFEEAEPYIRLALELDPLSISTACRYIKHLYYTGDHETCKRQIDKIMMADPHHVILHLTAGFLAMDQGRLKDALGWFDRDATLYISAMGKCIVYWAMGDKSQSDMELQRLIKSCEDDGKDHYQAAEAFAFRGDADSAFRHLELARQLRDHGLCELKLDPCFRRLRTDARWEPFLRSVGFPS
jgi:TolB-like protein/tetratricopeptide (TPR) repeat protein